MSVARCAFYIVICSRNGTLKPYNWKQCWFFFFLIMKDSCSKHRSFWTVEKLYIFFKNLLCNTVMQCFSIFYTLRYTENNIHMLNWTNRCLAAPRAEASVCYCDILVPCLHPVGCSLTPLESSVVVYCIAVQSLSVLSLCLHHRD